MEKIVPLISSRVVGPLGIAHLPRMWLKILLHATCRLPEGYRHGTGGLDERTLDDLGVDRDAFIAFVESKLPTYLECEAWIKAQAKNLDPDSIAKHNEVVNRDKDEAMARAQRSFIGPDAPQTRNATMLNDLDDWTTLHAHVTKGSLPPLVASSLNASFTELLKSLMDETKTSYTEIRLDLPEHGFERSKPAAATKRGPNVATEGEPLACESIVIAGGKEVASIAVHDGASGRAWSEGDATALRRTAQRAKEMIETVVRGG